MLARLGSLIPGKQSKTSITIVVPVYGDWDSLGACIASLKDCVPPKIKVMFVNDCGPEADKLERSILRVIEGRQNFTYFRNPRNLGFVQTCNRAVFELDKTRNDILLLNSDTKVTPGFLETMVTALHRSDNIASVSPRSNNATVFSVPFKAATDYDYPPEKSYKLWEEFHAQLPEVYETPTTHGFCMLIRRSVIRKFGLFDEVYGRGYGEENDFCMRVREHGYTHAIANRAFVFHYGSKSFSQAERDKRVRQNAKILKGRYPAYEQLVGEFITREILPEQQLFSA